MPFDPAEIYQKEFAKKLISGYDPADVNEYLDLIANYYDELLQERNQFKEQANKFKEQISKLEEQLETYRNVEDSLEETIRVGKEAAADKKESAQQQAKVIVKEAEVKADDILAEARNKAEEIVKEAKQKKDKLVIEAEDKKDKMLKQAQQDVEEKYKSYQEIIEKERLFKIRFKTLLKSQLEMLNNEQQDLDDLKERIESIKAK